MIISHKYKFIFIKTRKTAGTSVEIALSRYCGPDDILSPISLSDEPIRGKFFCRPRNYLRTGSETGLGLNVLWSFASRIEQLRPNTVPFRLRRKWSNWMHSDLIRANNGYYNHMGAAEVKALCESDVWNSYFKFCVDREPVDKTISHYSYLSKHSSIDEYLDEGEVCSDFDKYSIDQEICVDKIINFSSLTGELSSVCKDLGIPFDGWIPRAKSGYRAKSLTADMLAEHQIQRIESAFQKEYEALKFMR